METTVRSPAASNTLEREARGSLDAIFRPRNVAVIGATEKTGSVGRTLLWNLVTNPFGGTVFPVNPKRGSVLGIKAYPTVQDVPEPVDLAVVVTPAPAAPRVIGQCVEAGVPGAIIISAGFRELGPEGRELENEIHEHTASGRIRIVGPNCLGVMNPTVGLNATFASSMARPGNVAFISQSGALCTAILDWSRREQVGFSAFVSVGSMLDVGWGDLIDYLGDDPKTSSILMYMESVGDARSFVSAAREVALKKPIIVIKAGRTEQAARAAVSHTGSLAGSDDVLDAAFRRCGVLRVEKIADLFYMAEVLAKQPTPRGRRLAILTNAGGPAVLATDALVRGGGQLADLAPATLESLGEILPAHWSRNNPVDILGDAGPERYATALEITARDPNSDGLLVILTPQDMTDPTRIAEQLRTYSRIEGKPVLASWMGELEVASGVDLLNCAGIPTFPYPDTAAQAFNYMWRYSDNLEGLYQTPAFPPPDPRPGSTGPALGARIIDETRLAGRTVLSEPDSKRLLMAYGIPTVETEVASTEDEAVRTAERMGYPVVLKIYSETITHKTDVGGVRLDLADAGAVREAFREIENAAREHSGDDCFQGVSVQRMVRLDGYELILGSSVDAQFGPVLLFGAGGQLVEILRDRALGLPPLNTTLARRMMEGTRIYDALKGVRGRRPIDLPALEMLLVRFSQLVAEQPRIREIDINPLLASPDGLVALDARVVLYPADLSEADLPRLTIRPYPAQYVDNLRLEDGNPVTIRPIRPEDEPGLVDFHATLSDETVHFRYLNPLKLGQRVAHDRLSRVCFIDYDRDMALVVESPDDGGGASPIVGVGRLTRLGRPGEAEFAIVVSDGWQLRGLGTALLERLVDIGRHEGIRRITGFIHPENTKMRRVCEKLGFEIRYEADEGLLEAVIGI